MKLFTSKVLKERQKELQEMSYIEHLEETGKVDVSDISMEDVKELQEVLASLNYKTKYENDLLVFLNSEEKKGLTYAGRHSII